MENKRTTKLAQKSRVSSELPADPGKTGEETPEKGIDFRTIMDSSPDGMVVVDDRHEILMVNEQLEKMFGYSREELLGKYVGILIPPRFDRHREYAGEYIKSPRRRAMGQGVELYGLRKDGTEFPVEISLSPVETSRGILVTAAVRDVTERKAMEKKTKVSESYTRSLIEASLDPLVTISPEGKITDVNEATIKVTGVPRGELVGTDFSNYFTESEKAREGYKEVFEKGFVTDYPLTIRHRDGRSVDVLYNASVYKDAEGKILGVFAAARDVTEQKQASQYARSLIEASLDPLVTISPEGKITDVNEATVKVTGVPRSGLIATDFSNYFIEPEKAREGYLQVFEKGFVTDYPLTIRHRDGKLTDVLYNASVYKDVEGKVLGVFAAARDVTEQKQASQYARSLIEASLDPLVTISPEGKITDVNEATIKVTGIPRVELIGTDFSNYFTEPGKAREGYKQVFEKGFVTDYPLTIRHKDGRLVDVLYNASVYLDVRGNVQGVFAAARDVTEQKQASQYARSLIEASLDPLVTISPEGKITDVNEATIKVTGVSRGELIGTDFSNYFTEPEKAREGYKQVFEKGFVTDYPLTIRHKEGKLVDVLYNASVYKDVRGNVLGVFAAARDVTESKRVMREFAETKNFLDNILQSSTKYSIIGKDLNHRILSWNEGALRNYGYAAEEVLGKDSSLLHAPEDIKSGAVDKMLAIAHEQGVAEGEFMRVRKDGSRFVASVVVTRRDDASGKPIGYLLMSNDITEKKQAEEKLRQASQYARSLIEASLDPLVTISPEGKITDVNEATIKITGVIREGLIGTDFSNFFTEPEKAREGYRQVFEKGFVMDYPLTIRHASGKLTYVLYNASVYKDGEGNVMGAFAAARDITERKRMEEELRAASLYTRSLIEASLDPLVTISPEGKITDVNKGTEQVTGSPRERLVGSDFSDYFTEPDKAREGYQKVLSEGFVKDYPLTIRHTSGRLTDVLYNAAVYMGASGKMQGVFAAARDITDRKQAQENLRALNQQIQENLAASVSEILSLTAELAAVSNETAASVSETTATVEEVKQTSQQSAEKSRGVSETAQKAVLIAQQGNSAVTQTVEGINHIRGLMESVAESIVKLSEQTQTIGEIITTVNDLAQQSNLLSVNAAIEASKAGEQGKGFSVVAQEIKSLADQSKQATEQVRSILGDIQKATGAAVLAAEQVSKAVDAGVKQANESGESIKKLSGSVTEAAQAADQIAVAIKQQLTGMDQISLAMESIKRAAEQNITGTQKAEQAAHNLNEVGQKLKEMSVKYKV